MLLSELYDLFIEDKKIDVLISTIETIEYRYIVLDRYFSNKDIELCQKSDIREYQKYLLNECDLSVQYTNHLINTLNQIVKFGFENGYLKHNFMNGIIPIRKIVKVKEYKPIWNLKQFMLFDNQLLKKRDKVIFNMLFFLGIRKGELLSLKWNEIDFYFNTVSIISTASRKKGGQTVTSPKTVSSKRTITMNSKLNKLLKEYREEEIIKNKCTHKELLEMYVVGNTYKMMSFTALKKMYDDYLKEVELPKMNLHNFRHSHATMLYDSGADIKAISTRLGHESVNVTLDRYIHTSLKAQKRISSLIDEEIESINKNKYDILIEKMKSMIQHEIVDDELRKNEIDKLMKMYNFLEKMID